MCHVQTNPLTDKASQKVWMRFPYDYAASSYALITYSTIILLYPHSTLHNSALSHRFKNISCVEKKGNYKTFFGLYWYFCMFVADHL